MVVIGTRRKSLPRHVPVSESKSSPRDASSMRPDSVVQSAERCELGRHSSIDESNGNILRDLFGVKIIGIIKTGFLKRRQLREHAFYRGFVDKL